MRKRPAVHKDLMLTPKDPYYRKPRLTNRAKSIKVLTKAKRKRILDTVIKYKDDKMTKTQKTIHQFNNRAAAISTLWLMEAVFRSSVGLVLIVNFSGALATLAGMYGMLSGTAIILAHFVIAHKQ